MNQLRFDGKVAVVTGAGRGLGRDYALLLASRGAKVVVNDLGHAADGTPTAETPAASVVGEILHSGGIAIISSDSVLSGAHALVANTLDVFGRLDILVNNAGISGGGAFAEIAESDWNQMIDTHLGGTVAVSRAAWPHLVASGNGRIVNMSSSSSFGAAYTSHYSAAKSAIIGLTRSLGAEGAPFGIHTNAVMPTAYTRLTAQIPDEMLRDFLSQRFEPARVAPFVAWLVHETTLVNGEIFSVGGGRAARVLLAEAAGIILEQNTPEAWAENCESMMSLKGLEMPLSMTDELIWKLGLLGVDGARIAARIRSSRQQWGKS